MLKSIVEKLTVHLLAKILIGMSATISALAIWAKEGVVHKVSTLSPSAVAILLVTGLVVVLLLSAFILYLLPSFKYIPKYQFYQHRVNGLFYCPTCRAKKPLSPLRYEKTGWRCPFKECGKFYKNPAYKAPPEPPRPTLDPRTAWMAN